METREERDEPERGSAPTEADAGELSLDDLDCVVGGLLRPWPGSRHPAPEETGVSELVGTLASAALVVLLLLCPLAARAQAAAPGLTLGAALELTLRGSFTLAGARQQLQGAGGTLMAEQGRFSTLLTSTIGSGVENAAALTPEGGTVRQPGVREGSYEVTAARLLRSGVLVQPSLSLSQTLVPEAAPFGTNDAAVNLQLTMPLLQDRGGRITGAPERAARATYTSQEQVLRHTVAAALLDATVGYWSYLDAQEQLSVYLSSEARAQRLLEETQVLVRAGEQPAADLNQLRANLASKHIARHMAEARLLEARRSLGLVLGLDADAIMTLPPASDSFPVVRPFSPDSPAMHRLVERSLAARADLESAHLVHEAGEIGMEAARAALVPRLDLSAAFGYRGRGRSGGMRELVSPLYQHVPGLTASVSVAYRWPLSRDAERGRWVAQQAQVAADATAEVDLRRRIATAVQLAAVTVQHRIAELAEAESALGLYDLSLQNEKKKHQLDAATLLDVLIAEDGLTNSMLEQVDAHMRYAVAVATLRFETGTLLPPGEPLRLELARLLEPPAVTP